MCMGTQTLDGWHEHVKRWSTADMTNKGAISTCHDKGSMTSLGEIVFNNTAGYLCKRKHGSVTISDTGEDSLFDTTSLVQQNMSSCPIPEIEEISAVLSSAFVEGKSTWSNDQRWFCICTHV